MFTVIVPTMWKGEELSLTLPLLDSCPAVGEILLINNNINQTPAWFRMVQWNKVKTHNPPLNIFVNPAFNLGVSQSKYEQIALIQDDIVFDPTILIHTEPFLTDKVGVMGCDVKCLLIRQDRSELSVIPPINIKVEPLPLPLVPGYATLMMLHKKNWNPIDETLKIHLGEEWIVQSHLKAGLTPLIIRNFFLTALGVMKTSGLPEFKTHLTDEGKSHDFINKKIWRIP